MGVVFAENLVQILQQKGWSQKQLADAVHITESAVSHYIKGDREPNRVTLANIASALGVSESSLTGCDDKKEVERSIEVMARNASNLTSEQKLQIMKILSGI